MLPDIAKHIKKKFGLKVEVVCTANLLLTKIPGVDNYSLAKWIYDEFDGLKVTINEREGYKFNNLGWIKIEQSYDKQFILS